MVFSIFVWMRILSLIFCLLLVITSCRLEEQDLQQIDQVIRFYVKDANGKDLLNSKLSGTYKEVLLKDLGGERDQVPIGSASVKKDRDTLSYIEYVAGARRNLTDSLSPELKRYRSDILVQYRRSTADSTDSDSISIFYEWTPKLFSVKQINYNGKKVFEKPSGGANTFTIVK